MEARFAPPAGGADFNLTGNGLAAVRKIARNIQSIVRSRQLRVRYVYCSDSKRTEAAAQIIADSVGCRISALGALNSIGSGVLAGKSEDEAMDINPDYVNAIRLFRAGLFNHYNLPYLAGKEDNRAFESRVNCVIAEILRTPDEDLKVVISHRSPILAGLIDFARRFHGYPADFFGHVQLDLGNVSWLEETAQGQWVIRQVNVACHQLALLERRSNYPVLPARPTE